VVINPVRLNKTDSYTLILLFSKKIKLLTRYNKSTYQFHLPQFFDTKAADWPTGEGMPFALWASGWSLTIEYEQFRGTLEKVPYTGLPLVLLLSGQ
jgi:hypothetical protein